MSELPKRVEAERIRREMSRADVARLLGVSASTVGQWIAGAQVPAPSRYKALAEFLGVTVDELARMMTSSGQAPASEVDRLADQVALLTHMVLDLRQQLTALRDEVRQRRN